MFKRIIIGFGLFFGLLVGAVFILPSLVPTDTYRDKLETELSRVMARDVSITGDIKLSTFPAVQIEAGAVTLANPEGFGSDTFIQVEGLDAKVRLWPLLKKQVEISQISLNRPNIWLERKADGSVNWTTDAATPPQVPANTDIAADVGFRRDGRFTDYDPALDLLTIKDGQIRFIDSAAAQDISVKDINLNLRAPALSKPLKLDGYLTLDGLAVSLAGQLASPLDFLKGQRTSFDGSVTTELGNVDVSGAFLESDIFDVDATFELNASDPAALAARLTLPDDLDIPALNTVAVKGSVATKARAVSLSDLDVTLTGNGLDVTYKGKVGYADTASAKGNFTAALSDTSIITPYLNEPIQALDAIESVRLNGELNWDGTTFNISALTAETSGEMINANFQGDVRYSDALDTSGRFEASSPDLAKLLNIIGVEQPDASALKAISAKGLIDITDGKISATDIIANATDGFVNGGFTGQLAFDETLSLNGTADAKIADLLALNAALSREIPFSNIAKRIDFKGNINVANGTFTLTESEATLADGDVNGSYRGKVALGQTPDIAGTLTLAVPSLRTLSQKQNVTLPANTNSGDIFEAFALSGQVSGAPDLLDFTAGQISLDGLSGKGDFKLSLQSSRPTLTGDILFSDLDLQPYMAAWSAQKPQGQIIPWSTAPINVSGLKAMDANVTISAPSINMTRLALGQTRAVVTLKNGALESRITNADLYGGTATGVFSLNASDSGANIRLQTDIGDVKALDFMMAMGGFDKVTGTSDFNVEITGGGNSQAAIMKSLTGAGEFQAINGQLLGINAETLLTGIDGAITNRALPAGLGLGQTTDFRDVIGGFSISEGRVSLRTFQLQSGALFMEGAGEIDLGNQTLDVGIRPKLNSGSDVASFGVPLRFSGAFGQARPGLDTDMLGQIAQAKARKSAGDAVKDRVGGTLGSILGGVIGGQSDTPSSDTPNISETPETSETETPESGATDAEDTASDVEDIKPEEEVLKRLNGLFGSKDR
jgi:AsmA protein